MGPPAATTPARLRDKLAACGIAPAGEDGFEQPITGGQGTNLLGTIAGTLSPDRVIILSAHFDHIGAVSCLGICNGAYDNAAGVSAVVEIACQIAHAPLEKTVLVALWDSEEPPTFLSDAMVSRRRAGASWRARKQRSMAGTAAPSCSRPRTSCSNATPCDQLAPFQMAPRCASRVLQVAQQGGAQPVSVDGL